MPIHPWLGVEQLQPQPQALLCVLDITLNGLLLPVDFFQPQIAQC